MQLLSKILEQLEFKTRPQIEKYMLIVFIKSAHEEHLYQPLQSNNKQFNLGITFLTG